MFFYEIQDTLSKLLKGIEPLNFEKKNNPILKLNTKLLPESKKQAESRKDFYKRIHEAESKAIITAEDKESKMSKANYEKENDPVLKVLKLIEISCKVIAGFPNEIEADDRTLLLDYTLTASLKIVNMIFQFESEKEIRDIEKSFKISKEKICKELREKGTNEREIKKIEDLDIVHAFYSILTTFLLNLETSMSRIAVSKVSMPIISNLDNNNFALLLFKLISYEETSNFKGFLNCISLIKKNNNKEQILLSQRVVRMYLIRNDVKPDDLRLLADTCGINRIQLLSIFSSQKK